MLVLVTIKLVRYGSEQAVTIVGNGLFFHAYELEICIEVVFNEDGIRPHDFLWVRGFQWKKMRGILVVLCIRCEKT